MGYTIGQIRKRQEFLTRDPTARVPASISGDGSVLIFASETYSGTHYLYVFHKHNGVYEWVSTTNMTNIVDVVPIDCLALSPDGTKFICGMSTDSTSKGLIRGFNLNADGYVSSGSPYSKTGSGGAAFDEYGWNVHWSSSGERLFVVAPWHNANYGTVYSYKWSGTSLVEKELLTSDVYRDALAYGLSTSANDDLLAIGSWNGTSHYGNVRIYTRQTDLYVLRDVISPPSNVSEGKFGHGVALSLDGNYLFIGWSGYPSSSQGSIKTYHYNGSTWDLVATTVKTSPVNSQYFGNVLARAHNTNDLLIGHASAISTYQPYIYSVSGTVADDTDAPAERTIHLLDSVTGEVTNTGTSNSTTGAFSLGAGSNNQHAVICYDDVAGTDYNALIFSKIIPE